MALAQSMKKDLVSILDIRDEMAELLELATRLKRERGVHERPLEGKTLAMIFEKSSTRTRVSFETAMVELGGHAMFLGANDMQIGRGETIGDTAKVLSRYVHGIMYRAFSNVAMRELAEKATVPVISGLDDVEHPCQALADLLTVQERKGVLKGLRMTYLGDGNNVCHSLMLAGALAGMHVVACCPPERSPDKDIMSEAAEIASIAGGSATLEHDPATGAADADVLYTDVWISMGDDSDADEARRMFSPYAIDGKLLAKAKPDAIVLHCLPAHRGEEISAEVMDGPQSVVFDQAENRLHAQKAVLYHFLR